MRVLKIVDQVSCVQPDYDGFVNEPKAGELMTVGLGGVKRPWMYNADIGKVSVRYRASVRLPVGRVEKELAGLKLLLDYHAVDS
jgi:hypothetical protein